MLNNIQLHLKNIFKKKILPKSLQSANLVVHLNINRWNYLSMFIIYAIVNT